LEKHAVYILRVEVTRLGSGGHIGLEERRLRGMEPIREKEYGKEIRTIRQPSSK
jgi:hypothetical protein